MSDSPLSSSSPFADGLSPSPQIQSGMTKRRLRWLVPTACVGLIFVALLGSVWGIALDTVHDVPTAERFFDPRRSPTFDETCVVAAIDYALSSNEANDVVFLGDSACRTGVDPIAFERLSGLRAYNLGIVGDLGPGVMLNIGKAYLSKHPAPQLMVVCLSPVGLEHDVPWYWIKLRDHFVNCFGFDTQNAGSLQAHLGYTFRQGTVLAWDRVESRFTEKSQDVRDLPLIGMEKVTYRQYETLTRQKRGHFELSGHGPSKNLDRPGGLVLIHKAWDGGLRRLAQACDKARIPLMVRFCPVSADATKKLSFERVEHWLRDLQTASPQLLVAPDQTILRYAHELCWDYSHANPQGTQKFTEQLAREVRAALPAPGKPR
jgi:hypothetical protein